MRHALTPTDPVALSLYEQIRTWPIYDPHSHINPHSPASRNLDEILGYHYYTELAHSAGMPAREVAESLEPCERARNLAKYLNRIENTIQYSWLVEIAQTFYGFTSDRIDPETIEDLYERADHERDGSAWDQEVWSKTQLEAVFLTNDFDDPLEGFDTHKFVPCLRTDDLVLKLDRRETVDRLNRATEMEVGDAQTLRSAIGQLFDHFLSKSVGACAISLPPDFQPRRPDPTTSQRSIAKVLCGQEVSSSEIQEVRNATFWMLCEFCQQAHLPFDLMIGPIRDIYPAGVAGGRDLFDRRVSLADYHEVFNHFPQVQFPLSTLSPDAGPELVAYSWIFPNIMTNGHWWYSNIPPFIEADLKARLAAVPRTKQIGYYSDAYKLEFILPKFRMYQCILAEVLAEHFVKARNWSEPEALRLATDLLLENPRRLFRPQR